MPRKKSTLPRSSQLPPVLRGPQPAPAGPATKTGRQADAIRLILDAIPKDEGARIITLGASGKGKTYFGVQLVTELQKQKKCSTAVILDLKDPERPQYQGRLVHSVAEARRVFIDEAPPFLVCRPGITAPEAASIVRDACESGERAAFFADELTPCLRVNDDTGEPQPRIFAGGALVWLQLQARGLGGTSVLNVQLPSHVPGSALDNATCYACFGLGGRSLEYSADLKLVPREAVPVVSKLERGQLCVFFADREWDATVYGPG